MLATDMHLSTVADHQGCSQILVDGRQWYL
ncbi:hypothetical protein SAMN04515672_1061 [Natronorubrum texcoconense]|uniref:Uncharacterized protein n=1 Tax=Natronorubrum texcoconense TaxID=1095776 RepID=A0A1G8UWM5_9EURY|nr:hypothetical protein SAMN04515672_1061 [Natronorubrum texcoconense]